MIKNLKGISLILILFITTAISCKKANEKILRNENTNSENTCFIKQNLNTKAVNLFESNNTIYNLVLNNELSYNLIINDKEYSLEQVIESAEIKFYSFNCYNDTVIIIEGDDYYSSVFFVYYLEDENLYYLGNFNIDQPDVENTGVLSKDFKIFKKGNKFSIDILLNNIFKNKIEFENKNVVIKSHEVIKIEEDFQISGKWIESVACENPIGITLNDNEMIMTVEPNQFYIHLIEIKENKENNILKYKLDRLEGIGAKDVYSESYINDKEVAVIKILNNNTIEFNWLGFYNKVNKQRQYSEPLISNKNPLILNRCY